MDWQADLLPAALLGGAFVLLLVVAEVWTQVAHPPPERPRKLVHLVGGLICLSFPWLITSPWTVAALATGLTLLFLASRRYGFLECLHGVERKSRGVEYYPAMVFALFWLSHDRPWLYAASLLALAVADALAALVGKKFGKIRYEVDDEQRSLEGSLTFFLAALAAIAIPLLMSAEAGLPPKIDRLPIAAVAAILVTLFEAISRHGRDNLWVPLGTYLVLSRLTAAPIHEAYYQLLSLSIACLVVYVLATLSRAINVGATLTLILAIYGCWALASFDWALPLICAVVASAVVSIWLPPTWPLRASSLLHMVLPVMLVTAAADLCAIADREYWYRVLYSAFLAGCLVVLVQNLWHGVIRQRRSNLSQAMMWCIAISFAATAVLTLPLWLRGIDMSVGFMAVLIAIAVLACLGHDKLFAGAAPHTQRAPFVAYRYVSIAIAMLVGMAVPMSGLTPLLSPR